MKNLITTATFVFLGLVAMAQEVDPERMNRDLKVSEDIISSLFKNQSTDGHFYSVRPKATYVPDFGVMINIHGNNHFYSKNMGSNFSFSWSDGSAPMVIDVEGLEDLEIEAERLAMEAEELAKMYEKESKMNEEREREIERHMRRAEVNVRRLERHVDGDNGEYSEVFIESDEDRAAMRAEMKTQYKEVMTSFFTDYADLIGQLDDKDKIMLTSVLGVGRRASGDKDKLSATVSRKDLSSYKSGKLSKEKFVETISFVENAGEKKSPDLELLSSIFQRLYKSDLATTYYCHEPIPYERLENFGVIYKMKVYSSTSYGKDNHKITTTGQSGLSQKERDAIIDGMYPKFEQQLKENILDYAKTVKSLADDENLIFQVNLTQCDGCAMPKQIDVTVQQSVLKAYDSGKMKRDDAFSKISVKEGR